MFNWGFVGSAGISGIVAKEVVKNKEMRIKSVYSRNFSHCQKFAETFNCEPLHSFEEMLNDPEINGIYVAVPHAYHAYYSKLALEHHKPVLCEKPLTLNYESSKELFEIAEKNDTYFSEAMWTWFNPTARKVKEWIDTQKIGKAIHFDGDFSLPSAWFNRKQRLYSVNLGGGSLFDLGVYPVCYAYALFGYPDEIIAKGKMKNGIDFSEKIIFKYKSGLTCKITASFLTIGSCAIKIKGENGTITVPYMFHQARKAFLKGINNEKFLDEEPIGLYEREFLYAAREIQENKKTSSYASKQQSLDVMKIMEEIKSLLGLKYAKDN